MNAKTTITLNTGTEIPIVGLGTWRLAAEAERVVLDAIELGYRHIDTASFYGNEVEIGRALGKSPLPRKDIFVTTKVWTEDQGYENTLRALEASLQKLALSYVDLYLVHWPVKLKGLREETWRAMERLYTSGKARAIGVSNYDMDLLEEMREYQKIAPAVNQIEAHPFKYRISLIEYCHTHGIVVTQYSPLARMRHLDDERIKKIADAHDVSPAQVLLRWGVQLGNVVIPKSSNKKRLAENIDIFDFELTQEEMTLLSSLDTDSAA